MSFWDVVWFILISFAFVAYLMVMFSILLDLFRDPDASGLQKSVWVVALIFLPLLTAIAYLIARGGGMAERQVRSLERIQAEQDAYVRQVAAAAPPTEQIARARSLLDAGTITPQEYERLKEKALT